MAWPNGVVEQKSSIRKLHIDGLPFTTKGYERAKNILKSENKKQLGIANALISNIIWLPVITTAQKNEQGKLTSFTKSYYITYKALKRLEGCVTGRKMTEQCRTGWKESKYV